MPRPPTHQHSVYTPSGKGRQSKAAGAIPRHRLTGVRIETGQVGIHQRRIRSPRHEHRRCTQRAARRARTAAGPNPPPASADIIHRTALAGERGPHTGAGTGQTYRSRMERTHLRSGRRQICNAHAEALPHSGHRQASGVARPYQRRKRGNRRSTNRRRTHHSPPKPSVCRLSK